MQAWSAERLDVRACSTFERQGLLLARSPRIEGCRLHWARGVQEAGALLLLLHPAAAGQWLRWHPLSYPRCGLALWTANELDSILKCSPLLDQLLGQPSRGKSKDGSLAARQVALYEGSLNLQHQPCLDSRPGWLFLGRAEPQSLGSQDHPSNLVRAMSQLTAIHGTQLPHAHLHLFDLVHFC